MPFVGSVGQAKNSRTRQKLITKIQTLYEQIGGSKLGPAAQTILSREVDVLLSRGSVEDIDLQRIAGKMRSAQLSEESVANSLLAITEPKVSNDFRRSTTPQTPNLPQVHKNFAANVDPGTVPWWLPKTPPLAGATLQRWNEKMREADWDQKIEQEIVDYKNEVYEKKRKENESKLKLRHMLDQQLNEQHEAKKREYLKEEDLLKKELEHRRQMDELYKQQEMEKRKNKKIEQDKLKLQILQRELEKKIAEEKTKSQERDELKRVLEESKSYKAEVSANRNKQRQETIMFMEDNAKMAEIKKTINKDEASQNVQSYSDLLEEQDKQYLKQQREKQKRATERSMKASAAYIASAWELQARDEEKARLAREKIELEQQKAEEDKKKKDKITQMSFQETLKRQIAEKEAQKRQEEQKSLAIRRQLEAEVDMETQLKEKQKYEQRMSMLERARELEDQIMRASIKARQPMEIKIGQSYL